MASAEVLAGSERRRRWSLEQKQAILLVAIRVTIMTGRSGHRSLISRSSANPSMPGMLMSDRVSAVEGWGDPSAQSGQGYVEKQLGRLREFVPGLHASLDFLYRRLYRQIFWKQRSTFLDDLSHASSDRLICVNRPLLVPDAFTRYHLGSKVHLKIVRRKLQRAGAIKYILRLRNAFLPPNSFQRSTV
jgi:hypothetical protein